MRSPFRSAVHFVVVWLFAYSSTSSAADGPINDGSIELQQLLLDANKHDVERYGHGEIECEIEHRNLDGPRSVRTTVSHLWWTGEKFRVVVKQHSEIDASIVKAPQPQQGIVESRENYEQIADDKRVLSISDAGAKAVLEPRAGREFPPDVRVSPRDWWFGKKGGEGRFWYETLGPYPSFPQGRIKSFHTNRLDADTIEIERADLDGRLRAVASTAIWKVLDCTYESFGKQSPPSKTSYHYKWSRRGDVLIDFAFKYFEKGRSFSRTYKVNTFRPDYNPPDTLFSTDLSRVKDGYYIEDRFTRTTYLKGDKGASERLEAQLKRYADRVRARGFLARGKE